MKGLSPIIATLLLLLMSIGLASMAWTFFSAAFTSKTKIITLIDSFCSGTTGHVILMNDGMETIRASEQMLIPIDEACTEPTLSDIPPGARIVYNFTDCTTGRRHRYRLEGPSNYVEIMFSC